MAKKALVDALESLKDSDAWKAIVEDLDRSQKFRENQIFGYTGDMLGLDFQQIYSQHDLIRSELRFIEIVKHIPEKLINMEKEKMAKEEIVAASEIQENIDALSELQL